MQAPRAAARVEPWNVEEKEAAGDYEEFEEPEELGKVIVGRASPERQ